MPVKADFSLAGIGPAAVFIAVVGVFTALFR